MIEQTAIVRNKAGIHCRPATQIAAQVRDYGGTICVRSGAKECDPRSLMSLLVLELQAGTEVLVQVDGPGEEEMCRVLVGLFETDFDAPSGGA